MSRIIMNSVVCPLIALGLFAGCGAQPSVTEGSAGAEPNAPAAAAAANPAAGEEVAGVMLADGTSPTSLATVEVEPGHTISYFEGETGAISMLELAQPGQVLLVTKDTDALELYAQLNPGKAPPAELVAAYDRAQANHAVSQLAGARSEASGGTPEVEGQLADPSANFGAVGEAISSSSNCAALVNDTEMCDWASAYSACRCNWNGGFYAQTGSASTMFIIADHYSGNGITIRLLRDGTLVLSATVQQGQIGQLYSSGGSATRRCEVTNASGDAFHVGCLFND